MTTLDDIAQKLVELLMTYLTENVKDKKIPTLGSSTDLTSDLELESIQIMEYVVEIEDSYDISIDLESLSNAKTINDLAQIVAREMN
ncbi:MAG: acyl carrier protein [Pseudomonadales bacterium]|nr:acyl carrier protein [Pseudomonadales bacterium]